MKWPKKGPIGRAHGQDPYAIWSFFYIGEIVDFFFIFLPFLLHKSTIQSFLGEKNIGWKKIEKLLKAHFYRT